MMAGRRDKDAREKRDKRQGGNGGSSSRRFSMFLRSCAFDYLLVLTVSAALVFTVSYGFNSAPDLRGDVGLIAGFCALLLVPLYAGAWSKRALVFSALGYVVLAAIVVVFISSLSPFQVDLFVDGQINDIETNYAVFALVLVAVPPVVYLLSRRTWGVAALLFLGALACGSIQFLYRDWITTQPGTIAAIVVYVGIGALFVMQGYRQGVMKSHIVKKTSFFAAFALGVVGALVCALIGIGAFYGIIKNLDISTVDAKPFEDYYSRDVVLYDGTYQRQLIYDPNTATSNLSDEVDETNDDEEGTAEGDTESSSGGFNFIGVFTDILNFDDWSSQLNAIFIELPMSLKVLLVLLPFAIVALIVWLRYRKRARRLAKMRGQPYTERVAYLYNFFIKGFGRLGIERPESATPLEFALSASNEMTGFMRNASKADFLGVTLIYQRAVFGAGNVSERDYRYVEDYYKSFFKNAHRRMGHLKWVLRGYWRI